MFSVVIVMLSEPIVTNVTIFFGRLPKEIQNEFGHYWGYWAEELEKVIRTWEPKKGTKKRGRRGEEDDAKELKKRRSAEEDLISELCY